MEKECKHCKKIINYEKHQQFAGHLSGCKFNPNYKNRNEILSKSLKNSERKYIRHVEKKEYEFNCLKCNEKYKLLLTEAELKRGKYKKNCSLKCANSKNHSLETKNKIGLGIINKGLKYSKKEFCKICGKEFEITSKYMGKKYCSIRCTHNSIEYKNRMSSISKKRCEPIEEKIRMREIGRMGGFGKKGYTEKGTFYQSALEQKCFEYLEVNNVEFIAHKNIPNSSKVSDVYLIEIDLWVEIDGIDREKRKKWLGENYNYWLEKLEIYKREKLDFKIVKNFEEFKEIVNKIIINKK
jgi:hypothetical protein